MSRRVAPPAPRPPARGRPEAKAPRRSAPGRFARAEGAGLSVEAVIVFPFLLWTLAATHVFWDGFRTVTVALKATYTISDMMSRKPLELDQPTVDGMHEMLDFLTGSGRAGGTGRDGSAALRVSVVRLAITGQTPVKDGPDTVVTELRLECSETVGGVEAVSDIAQLKPHVPPMAPADRAIVVETFVPWAPLSDVGLAARSIEHVAVTRPRYVGEVCWDGRPGG